MKNTKISYVATSIFITLLVYVSSSVVGFPSNRTQIQGLSFKGKTNKQTYILGEPVRVEFEFVNEGETSVIIPKFGVEVGSLKIFIAGEDGEYKRYMAPSWGKVTGAKINLKPKQLHKFEEAIILWKPIDLQYAFHKPGIYFIKGISYVGENATPIESEPIQILVNEPVGDDLIVWNRIKGSRNIGYLMQTDELYTEKEEEKTKLVREIESIIENYPNSIYSSYLKPSLNKYRVSEARRKKDREEFKQQ